MIETGLFILLNQTKLILGSVYIEIEGTVTFQQYISSISKSKLFSISNLFKVKIRYKKATAGSKKDHF